jgi:hypothetical protein
MSLASAAQAQAPDMFKDVPNDHWAYQAVENLRARGIVIGYPDGYFRGKRTLTRYEFAVALDRALKDLEAKIAARGRDLQAGPAGPQGPQGPAGPAGPPGPPGMTPEEVAALRRLTQEFRDELAALGNNMRAVQARVDQLAREVAAIREELNRMPKISGNAFLGIRGDVFDGDYVDHDGRVNPLGTEQQAITHAFRLGVDANVTGGAQLTAGLSSGNYKDFIGGNIAQISPRPQGINITPVSGHFSDSLSTRINSDTYLDTLELRAPFSGIGRNSALTIGRFAHRMGRLVMWRPDVDTYFNLPWLDDGNYRIDGARLRTNFGSLGVEAFGGAFKSVQGANGMAWNSPLAGTAIDPGGTRIFEYSAKPINQPTLGQMTVDEVVGLSADLNFNLLGGGHIRLSALDTEGTGGSGFTGVHVLGAELELRFSDRFNLTGDWAKSITHNGTSQTVFPHFNQGFNAAFGLDMGAMNLSAGYRKIPPHFYTPGYWGRIGNWLNPTNIQGPTGRFSWDMGGLDLNLGVDWFRAARNRADRGGMGEDDEIVRALAGIRWELSRSFSLTADWEGVYWTLKGAHSVTPPSGAPSLTTPASLLVHPTEHYITLGTGYNLTANTLIRLMYQIGAYDGHNLLMGAPGVGPKYNFNVVTGQVAVRF